MSCEHQRVMALYPTAYGFAYVHFERRSRLVDWLHRIVPGSRGSRNERSMEEIGKLFDRYQPDIVALEDWTVPGSRRSERIRRLCKAIKHEAQTRAIEVKRYTREDIRGTYASVGARSRYEIAQATAREFPALAHRMPQRKRKRWEGEQKVIELFQAAALSLTCYRDASMEPV